MPEDDALRRIVSLADAEGLLRAGSLERFVEGLRERGRIILEERVHTLERRVEELEKERRWRAEIQQGLEAENAWRRDSMAALEERLAGLEERQAWQKEEIERREAELGRCRDEQARTAASHDRLLEHHRAMVAARDAEIQRRGEEHARASASHDRLLAHHRGTLTQIAERLATIASWLPWGYRRAQASLAELAAALRREVP